MSHSSSLLAFSGVLLFLLALAGGGGIPMMRSPRLGLSAHLTGIQSGIALVAFGLLWPHLGLWPAWQNTIAWALAVSLYAIWLSLVLAGVFGAGHGMPIAGQGITTTRGKQAVVSALLMGGSLVSFVAVAAMLVGWNWQG